MNHVGSVDASQGGEVALHCACGWEEVFIDPELSVLNRTWLWHVREQTGWVHVPEAEDQPHVCEPPTSGLNVMPVGSIWQCPQCEQRFQVEARPGHPSGNHLVVLNPGTVQG